MRAAPLRNRVTIERPKRTPTDTGFVRDDYEPFLENIAAAIEDVRGDESWLPSQQVGAEVTTRIRIRYRPTIDATMRIRHRRVAGSPHLDDLYNIEGPVRADDRRVELHLFCRRQDAEGFRIGDPETDAAPTSPVTFDRDDITFDRDDITFDTTEA